MFSPTPKLSFKTQFPSECREEREKKDTVYLLLIRLKSSIFSLGEKAQTAPQEVRMREDIQFIILLFFLVK